MRNNSTQVRDHTIVEIVNFISSLTKVEIAICVDYILNVLDLEENHGAKENERRGDDI